MARSQEAVWFQQAKFRLTTLVANRAVFTDALRPPTSGSRPMSAADAIAS